MQRITRLAINYFEPTNAGRGAELLDCLQRNIANTNINELVVLAQAPPPVVLPSKVIWLNGNYQKRPYARPVYQDYFDVLNRMTGPFDLNIVANADIFFDASLEALANVGLSEVCLALSRWELEGNGWDGIAGANSQDTWIWQGRMRVLCDANFPLGIYNCDRRIAWELRHADYIVVNPVSEVRTYHRHQTKIRNNGKPLSGPTEDVTHCSLAECRFPRLEPGRTGVISFSLFGGQSKYLIGAVENAKLLPHIYPGWQGRFYCDESVPTEVCNQLHNLHCEVVHESRSCDLSGLFWRFLIADDTSFERWAVRDVDSRLNYRERQAVDAWIASGLPFHVMRDHPFHKQPIQGCAFGGVPGLLGMKTLMESWRQKTSYGDDEKFLAAKVWPLIQRQVLVHGRALASELTTPFPSRREFGRYVGERCFDDHHWGHADRAECWRNLRED